MHRRRALQALGGAVIGGFSGCTTVNGGFESYRYERDAPIDGLTPTSWGTLGHDARRSGYTPLGRLPLSPSVTLFARVGQSTDVQPVLVGDTAYFGGRRPTPIGSEKSFGASGLRAVANEELWFFQEENALASPTVAGDAIFLTSSGTTRALDRHRGALCWEYHEGRSVPTASPTVVDDTVYVTGGRVFALAARTGEVQWATDRFPSTPRGTAATRDAVFATANGDDRGRVFRFDPETGRRVWARSTRSRIPVPPVVGELVYVVDIGGRLRALDPSDGSVAWSQNLGSRSSAMPAVTDRMIYAVATNGTTLYAFDALTGAERWQFSFEAERARGPTVAGDTVYLPTVAGVGSGGFLHELAAHDGTARRDHDLLGEPVTRFVIGINSGLIITGSPSSEIRLNRLGPSAPE